jgi:Sigma-70, region 4
MRCSRLTLERELRDLLGTGRNAHIAARYYGFDGRGGETLQAIGNQFGLTRERVRQIVTAASKRLSTGRPVSPTLDRTIAFVVDHMPAAAGEIEAELRIQRLTSGLFRLEYIIQAAELLGRRLPFSITELKGERLVHARDIPSVDTIVRIARRLISRWGLATISNVVAEARKVESDVCDRNLVVIALLCLEDFHWLEQSADWFWLSDESNNPVLNRIRKILSVANPINISELRAGIARHYRMKGLSPPKRVLLEFCRQAPGLRVNGEAVKAEPPVSSDDVLSQIEKDTVHILSEHGGTMATSEFKSVCAGMGVNRSTFYQNLLNSPIISRFAGGLYGLIGSRTVRKLEPARMQSVHGHRPLRSLREAFPALTTPLG